MKLQEDGPFRMMGNVAGAILEENKVRREDLRQCDAAGKVSYEIIIGISAEPRARIGRRRLLLCVFFGHRDDRRRLIIR